MVRLYEYHRNTYTSANDYFVKAAQLDGGLPNTPPKLIRNIFGGSLGGPIIKDRLYFFTNYEGTRRAEAVSQTVQVPTNTHARRNHSVSLRGPIHVPGRDGDWNQRKELSGCRRVTKRFRRAQLTRDRSAAPRAQRTGRAAYLNTLPTPNCNNTGDGVNYGCFNFAAPISDTRTFTSRRWTTTSRKTANTAFR